jgi:hypothetical protein
MGRVGEFVKAGNVYFHLYKKFANFIQSIGKNLQNHRQASKELINSGPCEFSAV